MTTKPTPAVPEPQPSTRARKERSTNYPAHTIHEAVARAEPIWKKEKKVPVSSQIAAEHMGFKNATSGASAPLMSSLRKYGIIESAASGEIRISDDANIVYIYPPDSPEHGAALKRLAMRPPIFTEVLKAFPTGLPSDLSLRAKLVHQFKFASTEAADAFIRTLRAAVAVATVDGPPSGREDGGRATTREDATTPPAAQIVAPPGGLVPLAGLAPSPTPASPTGTSGTARQERHAWKLGNGVWAEITITGKLTGKSLTKLKGYIALLDAEDGDGDGASTEEGNA